MEILAEGCGRMEVGGSFWMGNCPKLWISTLIVGIGCDCEPVGRLFRLTELVAWKWFFVGTTASGAGLCRNEGMVTGTWSGVGLIILEGSFCMLRGVGCGCGTAALTGRGLKN